MNDNNKTKEKLIEELALLRSENAALKARAAGSEVLPLVRVPHPREQFVDTIIEAAPT